MSTSSRSRRTAANGSACLGARAGSAARIAPGSTCARARGGRARGRGTTRAHSRAAAPSSRKLTSHRREPGDLAPRPRVEDLLLREPRPARLRDAELGVRERADRVRVGRDRDAHARLAREPRMDVAHVESVGLAVDLERRAGLDRARDDALDVDVCARAAVELPAGEVPDAVDVRMVDRREDPLGRAPVEGRVERGDDPVELREHVVVDVDRAVGAGCSPRRRAAP